MMQTVMETVPHLAAWLSTATPVLPGLTLVRWAQPVLWGIVLAGLAAKLLARQSHRVQGSAMVLALIWVLLPGPWSPAWWLGLAFQLPSLLTLLLCASYGWASLRAGGGSHPKPEPVPDATAAGTRWLKAMGLVMGGLLLADMFILLPFSLYRYGFSSFAFGLLLAVVLLVWVLAKNESTRKDAQLASAALVLFALTRLPSGNVFDALIDPWLWMVLVAGSLRNGFRSIQSRF